MTKKRTGTFFRYLVAIVLLISILLVLQELVMPKYMSEIPEGALIAEYYENTGDNDIIFIGDCEVYENFSPITLWREYGLTSYISGSGQQLIWQSYHMLEEILRYETPRVVIFSALGMQYDQPQSEPYNRLNIDGMRLGLPKIRSAMASMTEDESLISYVFPLLRYKARWSELTGEDVRYLFRRDPVAHNGFLMRADVRPAENVPVGRPLPDYQFGDRAYAYLDKMVELCEQHDIELVLIKAPSLYPYWYDQWDEQMRVYADEHQLMYINFLEVIDDIGLDFTQDTYDSGLHLNLSGAEKMSHYFGPLLQAAYNLEDHRNDPRLSAVWEKKVNRYDEMAAAQHREIEQYGYLKSFGARAPEPEDEQ